MGRIKGTQIKTLARYVLKANAGMFSPSFEEDKKIVASLDLGMSKTEKNKLAGEIAQEIAKLDRIARQEEADEASKEASHAQA
jgi:ribosomal protein S17E